jgi:hypothetical protein
VVINIVYQQVEAAFITLMLHQVLHDTAWPAHDILLR